MREIIRALLAAKFPNIDADNLTAVVLNTPNPIYSAKLLCGIYEEPNFEGHLKKIHHGLEYIFVKYTPDLHESNVIEYNCIKNEKAYPYNCSLENWLSWESI